MKRTFVLALLVVACGLAASAQGPGCPGDVPKETVDALWSRGVRGDLLRPKGWAEASAFFVQPGPPLDGSGFQVFSEYYGVNFYFYGRCDGKGSDGIYQLGKDRFRSAIQAAAGDASLQNIHGIPPRLWTQVHVDVWTRPKNVSGEKRNSWSYGVANRETSFLTLDYRKCCDSIRSREA
jgi:hypothetical protein